MPISRVIYLKPFEFSVVLSSCVDFYHQATEANQCEIAAYLYKHTAGHPRLLVDIANDLFSKNPAMPKDYFETYEKSIQEKVNDEIHQILEDVNDTSGKHSDLIKFVIGPMSLVRIAYRPELLALLAEFDKNEKIDRDLIVDNLIDNFSFESDGIAVKDSVFRRLLLLRFKFSQKNEFRRASHILLDFYTKKLTTHASLDPRLWIETVIEYIYQLIQASSITQEHDTLNQQIKMELNSAFQTIILPSLKLALDKNEFIERIGSNKNKAVKVIVEALIKAISRDDELVFLINYYTFEGRFNLHSSRKILDHAKTILQNGAHYV